MRLYVVAVGKLRDRALRAVADDYLARIRRALRCDEIEIDAGAKLERRLPDGVTLVALDPRGEALTSPDFAKRLERWGSLGKGDVAFLLGGADGIPEALLARATARLSLSPMTLPHRLARVVLLEQLYRALSILRGEPYARED